MTEIRALEHDTIQCDFFISSQNSDIEFWEGLCDNVNRTIKTLSVDYIWHSDDFQVRLPFQNSRNDDMPMHLTSLCCYGDNIEDEWFIVYLILEISKQFDNLIVQVKDNDGDFLLIEAADCLPAWANPDSTENRVFVHNGHVHLITPTVVDQDTELNLKDALQFVCDPNIQTEILEVQQAILNRIGDYPKKIEENIHRALVKLPLDVAALLALEPSVIAPLVNTYSNHDVIDAKICKNIKFENCVTVEVKFTKCLYAMLIHSKIIKTNKYAFLNEKKSMLGVKLTCGYQMIMSKLSEDVFSSKTYNKFLKKLIDSGYFKENIEGSKDYKVLLEKAKDFFLGMECPINLQICNKIMKLMSIKEFIEVKNSLKNKPVTESELTDDSEDWLNIHPEQLNELLNLRYGEKSKFKNDDIITAETITSELSSFLKQTSNLDGIEPNDREEFEDNNSIEFDSDEFVTSLKNMLNLISSDTCDMETQSDDSEEDTMQEENDELDVELKSKLHTDENTESSKTILANMIQSMKEEQGSSGPSSNLLRTIGLNKTDLLDSDDDEIF